MLRHDDVRLARPVLFIIGVGAVHQEDHVGVLLDRAGFAQVGDLRLAVVAHLGIAVELAQRHDRQLELFREQLERARELGDLLLAAFHLLARAHELQIVDHHELEALRLLEAAALGANLHEAHVRRIVDVQRGAFELAVEVVEHVPAAGVDVVGVAHRGERDVRLRGDDALRELDAAHLEAEDHGGLVVLERGRTREVHAERRFAHRGAAGHNHHLARLQALRHRVDLAEAGGDAGFDLAFLDAVDLVERRVHGVAQRHVVLMHLAFAHLVGLGLRQVDHVLCLRAAGVVAELRDLSAGGDHAAQQRALVHDLGVIQGVRGRRHLRRQVVQVVHAANLLQVAAFVELRGHRHAVHGVAGAEHGQDCLVDRLVVRLVEVLGVEGLRDLADRVFADEHAAQRGTLGVIIVRGHAVEQRCVIHVGFLESFSHSSRVYPPSGGTDTPCAQPVSP